MHQFLKFIFGIKLYMFRTVPVTQVCWQLASRIRTDTIAGCTVKKTPDDEQRNCPKHVEFNSKNKFEKLMHLVGFIIGISDTN